MGSLHQHEFNVVFRKTERVTAPLPVQEHWLPFSNLDLLLPPLDFGIFFCYKNGTDPISKLKSSLAKVLVTYYPFAGEVVTSISGEPELLCNNNGVDFIEAHGDVELKQLRLDDPDVSVENKLLPKRKAGVLCVQATELKCGGLVVACTIDHRIADAYTANMFLVSWAETATGKPLSSIPCMRKSLLNPRRPINHQHFSFDRLYVPLSLLPPPSAAPPAAAKDLDVPINRIYYLSGDVIEKLQAETSYGPHRRTKLEAFSAYLWLVIAKVAAANADDAYAKKLCEMGIVVDGRSRLYGNGKDTSVMMNYFGNVLSIPCGGLPLNELEKMELPEVGDVVHKIIQDATSEEHFLGLIDWVEANRPEPMVTGIYVDSEGKGPAVVVSSGQRFPITKLEFGWGKPVFASYHFPWASSTGYVMPLPSGTGDGWVVYVHLPRRLAEGIETEAGNVFSPITAGHLGLV